jgi:hypothetical protein
MLKFSINNPFPASTKNFRASVAGFAETLEPKRRKEKNATNLFDCSFNSSNIIQSPVSPSF